MADLSLTRRQLLKATGWIAAGVTVLYLGGRRLLSVLPSFDTPGEDSGAAWLQILRRSRHCVDGTAGAARSRPRS